MNKRQNISILPMLKVFVFLAFASSCEKEKNNDNPMGNSIIFNPELTYGSVTDIDSNIYKTIQIGTQTWMAENLKTTKYNDGSTIPLITIHSAWTSTSTPAYCWYENDEATYKNIYGALYNWYAISTTTNEGKNVCPSGWHVPTDAEWAELTTYLGGEGFAGGKLKETGTTHWSSPNSEATNSSGFTALPGSFRDYYGGSHYNNFPEHCYWWSSSEFSSSLAWYWLLNPISDVYGELNDKHAGFSVRCVKD